MRTFTAVIERCPDTGLFVGYVPGFPGAHSQGETLDELHRNLIDVIGMVLKGGEQETSGDVRDDPCETRGPLAADGFANPDLDAPSD